MTAVQQIRAVRVELSEVEEAPWNVNVVPPDKFAQLKADMQAAGPEGTDPIDTCVLEGKKYTCDGAHRLRAAKQLGWAHLYEISHPEILTEEQARLFNYKRDADRGDIDPFRLAASFKWFVDRGMKQGQVAKEFGVSQEKVSDTLALLKVDIEAKKELSAIPRGISVSVYEVLSRQPAAVQQAVARKAAKEGKKGKEQVTVKDLSWEVEQARREYDRATALQKALDDPRAKPEFKRCPECKAAPVELGDRWDHWSGSVLVVKDADYHRWCLVTGPKPEEKRESRSGSRGSSRPPQHEKSKVQTDKYVDATIAFFDSVWPKFDKISCFDYSGESIAKAGSRALAVKAKGAENFMATVDGEYDGKPAELSVSFAENSDASIDFRVEKGLRIVFKFEQNETKDETFGTYVRGGYLATRKDLHDLEDAAVDFLEEYGKLPRGNNPDWARIQKRKAK